MTYMGDPYESVVRSDTDDGTSMPEFLRAQKLELRPVDSSASVKEDFLDSIRKAGLSGKRHPGWLKDEKRDLRLAMDCAEQAADRIRADLVDDAVRGCLVVPVDQGTADNVYRLSFEQKSGQILLWTTGKLFEMPLLLPEWAREQPELMKLVEEGLKMRRDAGLPEDRALPKKPVFIDGTPFCPLHETVPMVPDSDGRAIRCRTPGCRMNMVNRKKSEESAEEQK